MKYPLSGMIKRAAIISIFLIPAVLLSAFGTADDSGAYYPIAPHNTLYYSGYRASEPSNVLKIKAEVVGCEKRDGIDYYFFNAPQIDVRFLMRKDKDGVYMRVMKYPFPVFSFIGVDVEFVPEIKIINFPLRTGDGWHYEGSASASLFGFFSITRSIKADFDVIKRETLDTRAGPIDAFCVRLRIDEGDGAGVKEELHWYGKNIGYVKSRTTRHTSEIEGYSIKDEKGDTFMKAPVDALDSYR
jgi:hypothetical protein